MIDQGLVCFGNLPELFSGGTDPKVWMVAADEYSIRMADRFVIRISRNAENSVEVHAASLQKTIKVLMEVGRGVRRDCRLMPAVLTWRCAHPCRASNLT